jgi:hypothetical protein
MRTATARNAACAARYLHDSTRSYHFSMIIIMLHMPRATVPGTVRLAPTRVPDDADQHVIDFMTQIHPASGIARNAQFPVTGVDTA